MSTPILTVENLDVAYGSTPTVHGVNLELTPGHTVALVGESGSGKTTTAQAILGLLPPGGRVTSGEVRLGDTAITRWSDSRMRSIRGRRIGWVPQDPHTSLNPTKTIGEAIAEAMLIHKAGSPKQIRSRVVELLERVGIDNPDLRARQYPHQLSGGMRQRVLIASAIALKPEVLIADEATSALDVTVQKSILDLLTDLRRDIGTAILLVTHDLAVAADRASHVVVLSEGKVVESGPTADILTRPQAPYTATLVANAPAFTTRPRSQQNPSYREDPPVITADQLSKTFTSGKTSHRALNAVSFAVSRGTTHALVGESGSGKTTTARAVMGFTRPSAGHVTVDGVDPHALSPKQLRAWRSRVQMVYQNPFSSLNPRHRIGDIIAEPLKNFRIGNAGERSKRVAELLDAVALPSRTADQRPAELSGGMRQRVAIARALAPSPAVVVLDEATSALDVTVQSQILTLLTDLQRDLGVTYLFISHNLAVVRQVSDTVSVMQHGSVVESGAVEEVFTNPTHPYTTALLSAIPGQTAWAAALSPIHI